MTNITTDLSLTHKRFIGFIVSLALFMDAIDTTILNTAIPMMARSLQVEPIDLKIALISYLVSLGVIIPISGWIADKYGVKRVFMLALVIFTLSSMWCGFARNLTELTISRACQGIGGSLMLPVGRLIILQTFKRHEIISAMNSVVMVVSLGIMLGPLAGGFITDHFSWQWIFWINVPIGLFAFWLSSLYLKGSVLKRVQAFDYLGFILFGSGLAALTFSLAYLSESTANHVVGIIILLIALLVVISYFIYAFRQPKPLINVKLLKIRTFRISILGNLMARLGFGGVPFLLPLLFQICLGYSAQWSGFLVAPIAIGIFTVKAISLPLLRFFGYKRLLLLNTLALGMSLWSMQWINQTSSMYSIILTTFMFGFFICLQYSALNSIAYSDIENEQLSSASSIASAVQQLGQSFGVAIGALLLQIYTPQPSGHIILAPNLFHEVFFTLGIFTMISVLLFFQLRKEDGLQMLFARGESVPVHGAKIDQL